MSDLDLILEKVLNTEVENEKSSFFGRKEQLKTLQQEFDNPNLLGSHWGIYGVRRSGKTALVQFFIHSKKEELRQNNIPCFHFSITGKKEKPTNQNAEQALNELFYSVKTFLVENDLTNWLPKYENLLRQDNKDYWERFFECLTITIKFLKELKKNIRFFCFFDEIAWLSKDNSFIEAYSIYLNQNNVLLQNVMNFLACSSNSWIKSRIFKNTTGFFERFRKMKVDPFSFSEIKSFFHSQNWISNEKEILKYYLLFGGFVKYYKEIGLDFSLPLIENIIPLINKTPYLKEEFDIFFQGIFSERKLYKDIVKEILTVQTISLSDLLKKFEGQKNKKTIERQISELKYTGVIKETEFLGEKRIYCCLPHFHLFYRFLKEKKITSQTINQWRGDMFELYVLDNLDTIAKNLNIVGDLDVKLNVQLTKNNINKEEAKTVLAQYDLVLESKSKTWRSDRARYFYIFELKFHDNSQVSLDYLNLLKRKENALKIFYEHTLPKKSAIEVKSFVLTTNQTSVGVFNVFDLL